MKDQERESLQRDLSDALDALQQGKSVLSLDGLAEHLVELGPLYRFHGLLIRGALQRKDHGAIIAQLIQVLDKTRARGVLDPRQLARLSSWRTPGRGEGLAEYLK